MVSLELNTILRMINTNIYTLTLATAVIFAVSAYIIYKIFKKTKIIEEKGLNSFLSIVISGLLVYVFYNEQDSFFRILDLLIPFMIVFVPLTIIINEIEIFSKKWVNTSISFLISIMAYALKIPQLFYNLIFGSLLMIIVFAVSVALLWASKEIIELTKETSKLKKYFYSGLYFFDYFLIGFIIGYAKNKELTISYIFVSLIIGSLVWGLSYILRKSYNIEYLVEEKERYEKEMKEMDNLYNEYEKKKEETTDMAEKEVINEQERLIRKSKATLKEKEEAIELKIRKEVEKARRK